MSNDNQNIILIGTNHANNGNCNHIELLKIIERIKPDVIFLEMMPSEYIYYYQHKTRSRLESDAILLYLEKQNVVQILVDYDILPDKLFFDNDRNMHYEIEKRSREYCYLIDTNSALVAHYGFKYLNSSDCLNLNKALYTEIEETLKFINNDKYFPIRKAWIDHEELRDNTMMTNIYNYCKEYNFTTGIFLTGTAHRKSIIEKIPIYNEKFNLNINWNYTNYENIL